jgi:hypothetical protein
VEEVLVMVKEAYEFHWYDQRLPEKRRKIRTFTVPFGIIPHQYKEKDVDVVWRFFARSRLSSKYGIPEMHIRMMHWKLKKGGSGR